MAWSSCIADGSPGGALPTAAPVSAILLANGTVWEQTVERFDVRAFGATGDGVTDDLPAFEDALQAANLTGGEVYVPPGTYLLASQLSFTNVSNVALRGAPGAELVLAVADVGIGGGTIDNVEISGLIIRGAAARMIAMSVATRVRIFDNDISGATLASASGTAGIWLGGVTDVWIERNYVHGNGNIAGGALAVDILVEFAGGSSVHVNNNVCRSTQSVVGIELANCVDSEVCENYVNGMTGSGANNNGYGILISQTTTCKRVTVADNLVVNTDGSGIYFRGPTECVAAGNIVRDTCQNQSDVALNVAGIASAAGNNVFSNNVIHTSGKCGISWSGTCAANGNLIDTVTKEGIWSRGASSGSVMQGNRIANAGVRGILFEAAAADVVIADNVILESGNNGIDFALGLSGGSITGNSVQGSGGKGIVVQGGSHNLLSDNVINGASDNAIFCSAEHCVYAGNICTGGTGIGLVATNDWQTLIGNDLKGNTVDGYTLGGINPIVYGNRFNDALSDKPAYSMTQQTADTSTASAAFVDFGTLSSTLTVLLGSTITVRFSACIKGNPAAYTVWRILVDGVLITGSNRVQIDPTGNGGSNIAIECETPALSAGAHTVKVQWHSDGAITMFCNPAASPGFYGANLECQEFRAN